MNIYKVMGLLVLAAVVSTATVAAQEVPVIAIQERVIFGGDGTFTTPNTLPLTGIEMTVKDISPRGFVRIGGPVYLGARFDGINASEFDDSGELGFRTRVRTDMDTSTKTFSIPVAVSLLPVRSRVRLLAYTGPSVVIEEGVQTTSGTLLGRSFSNSVDNSKTSVGWVAGADLAFYFTKHVGIGGFFSVNRAPKGFVSTSDTERYGIGGRFRF